MRRTCGTSHGPSRRQGTGGSCSFSCPVETCHSSWSELQKQKGRQKMHGVFESNAPVFGTAPGPIEHPTQQRETVQMDSRMRYFLFEHFFDPATSPDIKPCAVCFAEWLLAARARPRGPPGRPPVGLSRYYGRAQKTKKQAWVVQKAAGTYEHDDLPGACFRCGGFGHLAIDCPMQASSGSSGDNPGRAGVICPCCGAARKCQGDAFCSHCGSPF